MGSDGEELVAIINHLQTVSISYSRFHTFTEIRRGRNRVLIAHKTPKDVAFSRAIRNQQSSLLQPLGLGESRRWQRCNFAADFGEQTAQAGEIACKVNNLLEAVYNPGGWQLCV